MSASAIYKLPDFEFEAIRQTGGQFYISVRDLTAHLKNSAKAADEIDHGDIAKVLRLYRTALIEGVAGVAGVA